MNPPMIADATRPQTQSATVPALISRDLILSEGFKKIRRHRYLLLLIDPGGGKRRTDNAMLPAQIDAVFASVSSRGSLLHFVRRLHSRARLTLLPSRC